MSRTRRDTGFKPKPKAFHTTSGVGTNVSFRLSGNGSIADPFIVQKSLEADTGSFGKVQLVNDVYLIRKVVFGTTTDLGGSKSLMANLSNKVDQKQSGNFDFTQNNTEFNFAFNTNFGGSFQNNSSVVCFIGNSGVTSTNGYQLSAGEVIEDLPFSGQFFLTKTASGTCSVRFITG